MLSADGKTYRPVGDQRADRRRIGTWIERPRNSFAPSEPIALTAGPGHGLGVVPRYVPGPSTLISKSHNRQTPMGLKPPAATNAEIFREGRSGEQQSRITAPPSRGPERLQRSYAMGSPGRCVPRTGTVGVVLVVGRLAGGDRLASGRPARA